jgi:[glutamine synthetase] adenylyltransferase / [glutamine synthetase]-adenylyl-L-tyrosine phosphorylase
VSHTSKSETSRVTAKIAFADPVAGARNLTRVQERLGSAAWDWLLQILADSPDPDSVVLMLGRFLEESNGVAAVLSSDPIRLRHTCLVFGHSKWLGETLIRNVDLLSRLGRRSELERCRSREEFREEFAQFREQSQGRDLSLSLAQFRKREYVRILLRDVSGAAELAEVSEEISSLSDALLQEAAVVSHSELTRRHGSPQCVDSKGRQHECRFAVISLGKLGGSELNYSSDVDLLFLFDGDNGASNAAITNREFFIQFAQRTTELLSRHTPEGQVFRIDLRLRPQGHEGELAVALPQAVRYYTEIAQDWELQAMIKARHSAGDPTLSREFIWAIAPFIYRSDLNFAAIKTALQSRERIDRRGRVGSLKLGPSRPIDVKLDPGGIRDVEFLVQCLQRVYGGEEKWLRSRGTLFALQKLHDKRHISGKDHHNLTKAYEFFRNLEHHLQLRHGQQRHQLPTSNVELAVLAKCLRAGRSTVSIEGLVDEVRARMCVVAEVYRRVVFQEHSKEMGGDESSRLGLDDPENPETSKGEIMHRLAVEAPECLTIIANADLSLHARRNLDRFLSSAATSYERYRAVIGSPRAFERALEVFDCSEYLTDLLVRYPSDIECLEKPHTDKRDSLVSGVMQQQEAQSILRHEVRRALFRLSVDDLFARRDVWKLLAEYSDAADRALRQSLGVSDCPRGFAVMALGRLGSREFDILSDVDVLFVADEAADLNECRRAAERTMALLTTYTSDGSAFPIDTRLRPQGTQSELVTTCSRLERYFSTEARPWEAITYVRLRAVAGCEEVGKQAVRTVRKGIGMVARESSFRSDLREMRRRLEATDKDANFKSGPGGTYDIDFVVASLQAQNGVWTRGNFLARIAALQRDGLLSPERAGELSNNASFLRSLEHYVRLVTGRNTKWLPSSDHAQSCIAKLMNCTTGDKGELAEKLATVTRRTREIYLQYLFD